MLAHFGKLHVHTLTNLHCVFQEYSNQPPNCYVYSHACELTISPVPSLAEGALDCELELLHGYPSTWLANIAQTCIIIML